MLFSATLPALLTVVASATPIIYLTNCWNLTTAIQRAEIDYFPSVTTLPLTAAPTKIDVLSTTDTIDYEDGTWTGTKPFAVKVIIGVNAYTAKAGADVGYATQGDGTVGRCIRLVRSVVYTPTDGAVCQSDYACSG
ncbi:hypothetical protein LSUE1_G003928 [Lachnellula suecica]|uniref:Uncharacterized protein n=1 Tax=Lachnellula suecica TaxID=602035 RepID=A0A8T9C7A4_9HELO|nr:hypothetical protein LSUE1_G003928 [Lachnellula suecica]